MHKRRISAHALMSKISTLDETVSNEHTMLQMLSTTCR